MPTHEERRAVVAVVKEACGLLGAGDTVDVAKAVLKEMSAMVDEGLTPRAEEVAERVRAKLSA